MCGICGILDFDGVPVEAAELERMVGALGHRGPDENDIWSDGSVGLGHVRLSIIDLAGGRQPMTNEDESVWITYNGEVYNYRDVRAGLREPHEFRTRSDTEVLVHAYEEHGTEFPGDLRGFFAFGIWDRARRRLFLARDPLGKKPLFIARRGNRFLFASEIKALLAVWDGRPEVDADTLNDVLALRYVRGRRTGFLGIERLLPGETLTVDAEGNMQRARYWSPPAPVPAVLDEDATLAGFRERFDHAVAARLESEVPLGLLLSGGLDSTAVLESASRQSASRIRTFTVSFSRAKESEAGFARAAAEHFKCEHQEYELGEEDLLEHLGTLLPSLDEPLADPSFLPTALAFLTARREVTVCLTGDGGDETFGGYSRYFSALEEAHLPTATGARADLYRRLLPRLPHFRMKGWKLARALHRALSTPEGRYVARLVSLEARTRDILLGERYGDRTRITRLEDALVREMGTAGDLSGRMMAHDLEHYLPGLILPKVDRASMYCSAEARSPFLDVDLVNWAATVPSQHKIRGSSGKLTIRRALAGRVPAQLLERGKQGFGTPLGRWFRHELDPYVESHLLSSKLARDGYLDAQGIALVVGAHRSRRRNMGETLWTLLVLEFWYRRWILGE